MVFNILNFNDVYNINNNWEVYELGILTDYYHGQGYFLNEY